MAGLLSPMNVAVAPLMTWPTPAGSLTSRKPWPPSVPLASTVRSRTSGACQSVLRFLMVTSVERMAANWVARPWKVSSEPSPSTMTSCMSSSRIPMFLTLNSGKRPTVLETYSSRLGMPSGYIV